MSAIEYYLLIVHYSLFVKCIISAVKMLDQKQWRHSRGSNCPHPKFQPVRKSASKMQDLGLEIPHFGKVQGQS